MNAEKIIGATAVIDFEPELDPTSSLKDFSSAAYLQRGQILDDEVRKLANQIEGSNKYLAEINNLLAEANSAEYESNDFTETTWQVTQNGNISSTITLDDGYHISTPGDGTVSITDSEGNSLTYAPQGNGVLIPMQAGQAAGSAIAMQGNTSIILNNGTKVTFAHQGAALSISSVVITRGNQDLTVSSFNAPPHTGGPSLNGLTTDASTTDGDILVMNGGVHNLSLDEEDTVNYDTGFRTDITTALTDQQKYFINNQLKINLDLSGSMTQDKWTTLKAELIKIRDNLTGSNQLQVVLLQSALTKYNQNYDAMSNSENKIYSLLKEIGNKI